MDKNVESIVNAITRQYNESPEKPDSEISNLRYIDREGFVCFSRMFYELDAKVSLESVVQKIVLCLSKRGYLNNYFYWNGLIAAAKKGTGVLFHNGDCSELDSCADDPSFDSPLKQLLTSVVENLENTFSAVKTQEELTKEWA